MAPATSPNAEATQYTVKLVLRRLLHLHFGLGCHVIKYTVW